MWEDILKGKKIDFSFLRQISINLAEELRGRTLIKDEFLDFLESVKEVYFAKYPQIKSRHGKGLDTFRNTVPRILKKEGILEVKAKRLGPEEYRRPVRFYIFKE